MKFEPITIHDLATISGGMRWEHMRPSTNIEDRRHLSPRESMRVRTPPAAPIAPVPRTPGDLPSQAGIDDIGRHSGRRR
jgi:bacteriocin-like protein